MVARIALRAMPKFLGVRLGSCTRLAANGPNLNDCQSLVLTMAVTEQDSESERPGFDCCKNEASYIQT